MLNSQLSSNNTTSILLLYESIIKMNGLHKPLNLESSEHKSNRFLFCFNCIIIIKKSPSFQTEHLFKHRYGNN